MDAAAALAHMLLARFRDVEATEERRTNAAARR
jgi:hypothetical protein